MRKTTKRKIAIFYSLSSRNSIILFHIHSYFQLFTHVNNLCCEVLPPKQYPLALARRGFQDQMVYIEVRFEFQFFISEINIWLVYRIFHFFSIICAHSFSLGCGILRNEFAQKKSLKYEDWALSKPGWFIPAENIETCAKSLEISRWTCFTYSTFIFNDLGPFGIRDKSAKPKQCTPQTKKKTISCSFFNTIFSADFIHNYLFVVMR